MFYLPTIIFKRMKDMPCFSRGGGGGGGQAHFSYHNTGKTMKNKLKFLGELST
jgi:hypothetical protein